MLGAKERALLLALSETEYCTSGTLAKALGVSSKTAQGMVKDLREKLQENGADILARTRHGYLLQVNDRALFETLSSGENAAAHFIPSGSEERVRYLLVLLLGQVDYVKLDDVSEELYVSKYTISGDLHQVEEELAKYHLSILRRPNYGIRVTGREIDIRNCTAHVLANYNNMMPDGGAGYRNMAQRISQCLMSAMHKHALHFSEINFRNLVNTIFATIHRALQHAFIPLLEEDSAPDINENVYAAAHYLAELLEAQFDIRLPEPEVLFLALNIAGKCNYSSADREDENVVIAPEIMALVDDMLESIYESFKLDYSTNFLLRMNLGQHLVAMDIRLRYGMPIENPLLCEVQKHYSLAYALAEQAAIPLHRHYGRNVSEDEIGFLAYIFQLTLEQERKGFEKKNVLVVCSSGGASSRLIAYRFEEEFSKYLDNIEVCDVFHLEQYDFSKIDYIFSTVPIHQKVNVPIIRVEDFLNQSSMRVVQSILEGSSADFLSAYYRPELFFPHVEGRTKEEAIFNLCTQIDRVMPLPQGFYSAVLKREELARTDFCPLVAFPHAYKVLSENTFVAVGILDEPIRWVENDVQVLLLISIADGEHPELQKFYLSITSFMQDTAGVKSLIQCRDYPWFMRLLCGENGGSRENKTQKQNSKTQKEYESL